MGKGKLSGGGGGGLGGLGVGGGVGVPRLYTNNELEVLQLQV